jgi:hypothetical protein
MGLLDDAIRDHLDLKRRRGADPSEVERAEREALGPVRRAPVEPAEGELMLGPPVPEDEYVGDEHLTDGEWDEHVEAATELHVVPEPEPVSPAPFGHEPVDHEPVEDEHFEHDPFAAEPPASEPVAAIPAEPLTPEPAPPAVHEPEPEVEPEPRRRRGLFGRRDSGGDATVEYDVEDALGAEEDDGTEAEDVLEETPEFLQDTPDHDRLWFEQKPPKDFDFDG